ncbi:MAG: hypothetical protein ACRDNL_10415 [Spirillospora sp.]
MGKVSNPGEDSDAIRAAIDVRLAKFLDDFPEWTFRYEPASDLPWEVHRRPYRYPTSGCIRWVSAATEERLRELLTGIAGLESGRGPEVPAHGKWCVR